VDSDDGRVVARGISMPNEWGDGSTLDQGNGRTIFQTLSHEVGHTLGLDDEYTPVVAGRNLAGNPNPDSSWDLMHTETNLPHFTLPHRMMLGWIPATWVKLYNMRGVSGTTLDDHVTLSAVESGLPPPGQFAGIEIRIADGRNYYAEYRTGQVGEIGDQQLLPNARVVLLDVKPPRDLVRPDILLLETHPDDTGAVLDVGQFYHELDNTTPSYPAEFRFEVVSMSGNQAQVHIRYGVIGKPDPSIRPAPRDTIHQWQSPDIEVRNGRNIADSRWANVPWAGHDNLVTAQIKNRGDHSAPGVVANFFVKDYSISDAPEKFLGTDTHDIPPGVIVEFSTNWPMEAQTINWDLYWQEMVHYCIIVRINHYKTPDIPPLDESEDSNNIAMSNYELLISQTSIPSRELSAVTVSNRYSKPARFFIGSGQTNPLYRTYLEHTWLRLKPNGVERVGTMFEFAPDGEQSRPITPNEKELFSRIPNDVNIVGLIEDPFDTRLHGPRLISGVTNEIITGKSTTFRNLSNHGETLFGVVTTKDDHPVPGGMVVITLRDKNDNTLKTIQGPIVERGEFSITLDIEWIWLDAYYVGPHGYGDCETKYESPGT